MSLVVAGTNHKYGPIEAREKLYFPRAELPQALVSLVNCPLVKAGVILSTCNRVELYANVSEAAAGLTALKEFLAARRGQRAQDIEPYLYTYIGKQAAGHLFRVASGLDSQVIGEEQILGQVNFAYQQAMQVEAADRFLGVVFERAARISLKVRGETEISAGDVSLATIVLSLIKTKFPDFKDKKMLIIGVGKISQALTCRLKEEGLESVFIANKTFAKARRLAESIGAEIVRFNRLKEKLQDADIVISATSSPHLILRQADLTGIKKPLLIIDLALPRDVEPQAGNIKGVSLFDLDSLGPVIEKNLKQRIKSIPLAAEIIKEEVESLCLKEPLEWEPAEALWP